MTEYQNVSLLVLDEPSASLDGISEKKVYDSFNDFTKGKIGIFVTHRMRNIKFKNPIIVLEKGKVIEKGLFDDLMKKEGIFFELYNSQKKVHL